MRTDEEILDRIDTLKDSDFFGFMTQDLIGVLPFNAAKQYLVDGAQESDWEAIPRDRESVIDRMLGYMPFAWSKANGGRGLSAMRSMNHYSSWIWLAGDESHFDDLNEYTDYGKPNLRAICKFYGWDADQWKDE